MAGAGGDKSFDAGVPPEFAAGLGLPAIDDARLVAESFAFLLEHEPARSILPHFELPIISTYFPEYRDELRRRLTRWRGPQRRRSGRGRLERYLEGGDPAELAGMDITAGRYHPAGYVEYRRHTKKLVPYIW